MAGRILTLAIKQSAKKPSQLVVSTASMSSTAQKIIGNRDIVGYGWNGEPTYQDRLDYPLPPIRFKENTPDILALREKEKGDWKKLSIEEKKALYRASFCQTFAEFKYPSGEWKQHIGMALIFSALSVWVMMWMAIYVYHDHPPTLTEERKKAQLKRMLELEVNPIHGLASKWDYENKRWK